MYIKSVVIQSYKSIRELKLEFGPGVNLLVGPNNSGKSSVLEALELRVRNQPHRCIETVPKRGVDKTPATAVIATISTDRGEIRGLIDHWEVVTLPVRADGGDAHSAMAAFDSWVVGDGPVDVVVRLSTANQVEVLNPGLGVYETKPWGSLGGLGVARDAAGRWLAHHGGGGKAEDHGIATKIAREMSNRIRYFSAIRSPQDHWSDADERLHQDAKNLAGVLERLQSNTGRWARFVRNVRYVLPEVHGLKVPREGGKVSVEVWFHPVESERDDLTVPLERCGTGLAQILSLLCAVSNREEDYTVLIDEPHSFLHPGALKRLLRVLEEERRNQYVVSTHSPAVLTATAVDSVSLMRLANGETRSTTARMEDMREVQEVLGELGASVSDAFGARQVLWVEGQSEEVVLPLVMSYFGRTDPYRATFPEFADPPIVVRVAGASDLDKRHAEKLIDRLLDLHDIAAGSTALIPTDSGFLVDREDRREDRIKDLCRRRRGRLGFLERRMLENYLLDAEAIAAVLRELSNDAGAQRTAFKSEVEAQLNGVDPTDPKVHGAAVLDKLKSTLDSVVVTPTKPSMARDLCQWLLDHHPERLEPLARECYKVCTGTWTLAAGAQRERGH